MFKTIFGRAGAGDKLVGERSKMATLILDGI
jgi:hypothetical protein